MLSTSSSLEVKLQASHLVDALQRNVTSSLLSASVEVRGKDVIVRLAYDKLPNENDEYLDDIKAEFEALQIDMFVQPFVLLEGESEIAVDEHLVYKKQRS